MIPAGPIALLLGGIFWLIRSARARKSGQPRANAIDFRRIARLLLVSGWLFLLFPFLVSAVLISVQKCADGDWLYAPLALAALVVLFPWPTARWVLIPLGLPRSTRLLLFLPALSLVGDGAGGSILAAARALLRGREADPGAERWLERIARLDRRLCGSGIVGSGLLVAERGERGEARRLLAALPLFASRVRPHIAVAAASEWLVADAAERGDWRRVIEVSRTRGLRSRLALLLAHVATAHVAPAETRPAIIVWALWLLAPHRRATWPQVRRALAVAPVSLLATGERLAAADGERPALEVALARTAAMNAAALAPGDGERLLPLFAAWKQAFADAELLPALRQRGAGLGASAGAAETAYAELREAALTELATLALAAEVPLATLEATAPDGLAYRVREVLFADYESALAAIHRRAGEHRELPPIDEAREWLAATGLYERAVRIGGEEIRQLLFPQTHHHLCNYAVWLFNDRAERPLGNAILRWLLIQAEQVGDEPAIALQRKNLKLRV